MNFHRLLKTLVAICVITIFASNVNAQLRFPSFGKKQRERQAQRQLEATPIELTQESGPWLIMCASFVGDEAEMQALQLVRELRTQYGLYAYIYRHHFDYTGTVNGIGYDPSEGQRLSNDQLIAKPLKMKALHSTAFDEIAVLVGDFPTIEDARAQQTLQGIKYLMPESLGKISLGVDLEQGNFNVRQDQASTQRMRALRAMNKAVNASADKRKGPMGAAFMLANPLLPDEYFNAYRVDEFVLKLNRSIKHSLLKNPGYYTVRVATFRGDTTFELDQIQQDTQQFNWLMKRGQSIKESKLAVAAAKAHRLTLELRKLGIEAYEFHDRHESYVCVGNYEWLKKEQNGRELQNQQIVDVIEVFKGRAENFPGVRGAVRAKTLLDIVRAYRLNVRKVPNLAELGVVFDVQPIPVQVPKTGTQTRAASNQGNGLFR